MLIADRAAVKISLGSPPQVSFMGNGTFGPNSHPTYCLPLNWAIHFYNYEAEWRLGDGPWLRLRPGTVGLTPPGVTAVYRWRSSDSTHACAHFRLPANAASAGVELPLLIDLGASYAECHDLMQAAIGFFPSSPRRAEAILWSILWRLSDWRPAGDRSAAWHPAVRSAVGYVERHLSDPTLSATEVVRAAGISHNHLTRLFGEAHGTGVLGYIHRRRVERAERLLRETALPIKAVAAEVGVPDLQRFNKLVHKERGRSPRQLRRR